MAGPERVERIFHHSFDMMFRHTTNPLLASAGLLLASALVACSSLTEAPAQNPDATGLPDAGPDETYEVDFPKAKQPPGRQLVMVVSEDFNTRCPASDPHFAFDRDRLQADDAAGVAALARCFDHPEFAQRDVLVIGHADARGTDDYNEKLALERARTVSQKLVEAGIDPERLYVSGRGESQARGSDDGLVAHGFDRRVDVQLRDETRAPLASGVYPYGYEDVDVR